MLNSCFFLKARNKTQKVFISGAWLICCCTKVCLKTWYGAASDLFLFGPIESHKIILLESLLYRISFASGGSGVFLFKHLIYNICAYVIFFLHSFPIHYPALSSAQYICASICKWDRSSTYLLFLRHISYGCHCQVQIVPHNTTTILPYITNQPSTSVLATLLNESSPISDLTSGS